MIIALLEQMALHSVVSHENHYFKPKVDEN